ncbi:CueP family metal-binding protein [Microbacterium amylolyticum]|uniref:CueP family metal-binding protein n=1 Tax=Microbacterium amylolyticum TaxID=936337 RepID=A0ABS4ZHZ3_9MICO|nr:CueP family metal-binding protein [Microbacterium amylolyticum]MBP2436895.1 hypothetical protein [Microbacterium amylolyticum]
MKRLTILAAAAAAILSLTLAGCSAPDAATPDTPGTDLLASHNLTDMSAREIVDTLDRMNVSDRPADLIASVQPNALVLTDNVTEVSLDMPDDVTYVSVAPFVSQTHECFYHSLTTCRGELSAQQIEVWFIDDATGNVILEETTTTFDNGFAGFWLPRNLSGTIEVTYDGKTGETPFSTANDAATCITTLQLT